MTPFRLTATLKTPVIIGKRPVNLAGLLYHCCFLHTGDENKASELLHTLLEKSHGVYHASNMIFSVNIHSPLIATNISTSGQMRTGHDLSEEKIKPNGARGKYASVQVEGGAYKNRIEKHRSYSSSEVVFYGSGKHNLILDLLNYYTIALGVMSNAGLSGAVDDWIIDEMDYDYSFFMPDFKNPERQILVNRIPVEVHDGIGLKKEMCSLTPPFYKGSQLSECWISDRILKTQVK